MCTEKPLATLFALTVDVMRALAHASVPFTLDFLRRSHLKLIASLFLVDFIEPSDPRCVFLKDGWHFIRNENMLRSH